MRQAYVVRWSMGIGLAMSVSVCGSLSHAGTIMEEQSAIGSAISNTMTSSALTATEVAPRPMPYAAMPMESGLALRTVPTVSKQISVAGTTFAPYFGAGFGGGYATEIDRSLNTAASVSSESFNAGQKSLFGPQLIPNEVQLGVRFPF